MISSLCEDFLKCNVVKTGNWPMTRTHVLMVSQRVSFQDRPCPSAKRYPGLSIIHRSESLTLYCGRFEQSLIPNLESADA